MSQAELALMVYSLVVTRWALCYAISFFIKTLEILLMLNVFLARISV